jgi:metal-responsive CopG/Arc/MetJ family transcriptional regulator
MKTIAITIGDDILKRIDRVSENRSEFIRKAVGDFLMRMEQTAEEERERAILRRHRERLRREAIALIKDQAKP